MCSLPSNQSDPHLLAKAIALCRSSFGVEPTACGRAPGRVNLIGEHVDYCGGLVLPIAIKRQTVVVGAANSSGVLRVVSLGKPDHPQEAPMPDGQPRANAKPIADGWLAYVAGVIQEFGVQTHVTLPRGLDIAIAGDVPLGAGLSSSASLEVAVAMFLDQLTGANVERLDIARLCRRAEHLHAGVPCGIMDQYTSSLARPDAAILIDCESETHTEIPMGTDVRVIIADSGVKHALASGEYADRRRACERALMAIARPAGGSGRVNLRRCSLADLAAAKGSLNLTDFRRARHVITECRRTEIAAIAMQRGDWQEFGKLMAASHDSLRDDFEVSCPELDELADRANKLAGVFGARMTGGGFGGCIVALAAEARAESVVAELARGGRLCFSTPAAGGAESFNL